LSALDDFADLDFPDIFGVMLGFGMIGFVQGECFGIVVDGNVRVSPEGHPHAMARASSSCKIIDDDFSPDHEFFSGALSCRTFSSRAEVSPGWMPVMEASSMSVRLMRWFSSRSFAMRAAWACMISLSVA